MPTNKTSILQLLRLCSPALPIGSYAYSQGLETACETNLVRDKNSLQEWIIGVMNNNIKYLDVPVFSRLFDAHVTQNEDAVNYWNQFLLSSRETSELYFEDTQIGGALIRLLVDLDMTQACKWTESDCSMANAFCIACTNWNIDKTSGASGMIWSWCENQVGIGIKLIPLGQTNGQQIVSEVVHHIPSIVNEGLQLDEEHIGASSPGLVIASMQHEDQYSRLFRS